MLSQIIKSLLHGLSTSLNFIAFMIFCLFLRDRVSLYRPDWPRTYYVDQVSLTHRDLPVSVSKCCATHQVLMKKILNMFFLGMEKPGYSGLYFRGK